MMISVRVKAYLKNVAEEWVEDDGDRNYQDERDVIWDTMTQAEKDTANELVIGIFGQWIGV